MSYKVHPRVVLDRLAAGQKQKAIAAELGCSYGWLRTNLSTIVRECGYRSVEQAVAEHVAEKIKKTLPAALHRQVDLAMGKK